MEKELKTLKNQIATLKNLAIKKGIELDYLKDQKDELLSKINKVDYKDLTLKDIQDEITRSQNEILYLLDECKDIVSKILDKNKK